MSHIYDNISDLLIDALNRSLAHEATTAARFCVGYFNLRGWRHVAEQIERFHGGESGQCRLLLGMPHDSMTMTRSLYLDAQHDEPSVGPNDKMEAQRSIREGYRTQLEIGTASNEDEATLRRLRDQIRAGKVAVRVYAGRGLHAKLYLCLRATDADHPRLAYLGSSNLTYAGLRSQGELNIQVVDTHDCERLENWFDGRWAESVPVDDVIASVIDASWAGSVEITPFTIYAKIAYHLSEEARAGLAEFTIPDAFSDRLFDYQSRAVRIAMRHIYNRGGAFIGDVVGLGKTMMASAVIKLFEETERRSTLILAPPKLVPMWEEYKRNYDLKADVMSTGGIPDCLRDPKTGNYVTGYGLVVVDESHNFRNREGKRFQALRDFIAQQGSDGAYCLLLSATPFNKHFDDLSSQLRLFVSDDQQLGIRPEHWMRSADYAKARGKGEVQQIDPRTLPAFERSSHPDDWRNLMSLFMVRRTRSFILERGRYAHIDPATGRKYLPSPSGKPYYFPERKAVTRKFAVDESNPNDRYARLYAPAVVDAIAGLHLPRYGLGNYIVEKPATPPQEKVIEALSRAGIRLMGFCQNNLFKRLESSGYAFLESVKRHITRNAVLIHALEQAAPVPIGEQSTVYFDTQVDDDDDDQLTFAAADNDGLSRDDEAAQASHQTDAARLYALYSGPLQTKFKWLPAEFFKPELIDHLRADNAALQAILDGAGEWQPEHDAKLDALEHLLTREFAEPHVKVLVFSQFADTVNYLDRELRKRAVQQLDSVTGQRGDPVHAAMRFSPVSNGYTLRPGEAQTRVLLATDVLSEGQNLQDAQVIVNFDLPWAIIRLIQRAGRVDRIGQEAPVVHIVSFYPADGVEKIIQLRARLRDRLRKNAQVVGMDERFFEDDHPDDEDTQRRLYTEESGILENTDDETDISSQAEAIWEECCAAIPSLRETVPHMPSVVYSAFSAAPETATGSIAYVRTGHDTDHLALVGADGKPISESPMEVLELARCEPTTPRAERPEHHHGAVARYVRELLDDTERLKQSNKALGNRNKPRHRLYRILGTWLDRSLGPLFDNSPEAKAERAEVEKIREQLLERPLTDRAKKSLTRYLASKADDRTITAAAIEMYRSGDLLMQGNDHEHEVNLLCSLARA